VRKEGVTRLVPEKLLCNYIKEETLLRRMRMNFETPFRGLKTLAADTETISGR